MPDRAMISTTPEARVGLDMLAKEDGRSMARELEWLVRQELDRRLNDRDGAD